MLSVAQHTQILIWCCVVATKAFFKLSAEARSVILTQLELEGQSREGLHRDAHHMSRFISVL